ncbi:MAG TPA: hypothetical protein VIV60_28455 [Polyangiaceae bacterium]
MMARRMPLRLATTAMFAVAPIVLGGFVVGTATMARASFWMLSQVLISTVMSIALGFIALLAVKPGVLPRLDRFVARSFELVAAVPAVVATATIATQLPWAISLSVAIVVGLLDGLKCIREVASAMTNSAPGPARGLLLATIRRSLMSVLPTVIERIVTLEAALAWLELFPPLGSGGWGDHLGQSARRGELMPLLSWTLAAAGASCALKLLASRANPTNQ